MDSRNRGAPADGDAPRILVVEDDSDLAETYRIWLAGRDDVDPTVVRNGARALDRAADGVDLLVLDRELPDLSGPELLDRLEDRSFPVVVVSAYEPDDHLGADDVTTYVEKPVEKRDLLGAIDDAL